MASSRHRGNARLSPTLECYTSRISITGFSVVLPLAAKGKGHGGNLRAVFLGGCWGDTFLEGGMTKLTSKVNLYSKEALSYSGDTFRK